VGALWRRHRSGSVALITVFAALSCAQVVLLVAGYFLV
jgi:hypothetical protein